MGYYLETPGHFVNKAALLAEQHGGTQVSIRKDGTAWKNSLARQICHKLMEGFDLVVVVENRSRGFEAAAYAFDHDELDEFMEDEDKRRRWLVLFPKGVAAKLAGYPDTSGT